MPQIVKQTLHLLKLVAGTRAKSGNQLNSLRNKIKDQLLLKGKEKYCFKTDMGNRHAVALANSIGCLLNKDDLIIVLKKYKEKRPIFEELLNLLDGPDFHEISLYLGLIVMFWNSIIGPFESASSKNIKLEEAKSIIRETEKRIFKLKKKTA